MGEESIKKKGVSKEQVMDLLNSLYQKSIDGIQTISPPIDQFANDYLNRESDPAKAAKSMIQHQIAKCATSGFLTGFGGVITLPVSIPANIGSVLYVQMRMIACTAYLAGWDVRSDQVQTLIYACLAGVSVNSFFKQFGVKLGQKAANSLIKKIPGQALIKINQKIGFRFITKFGQKGLINLGKLVPGIGAVINGSLDFLETRAIGNRAYQMFFEGDFSEDAEEQDGAAPPDFDYAAFVDVDFTEID